MKRRSLFLHCCDDALSNRQTKHFLDCVHRTFLYKINEFHYIFFLVSVCCKFSSGSPYYFFFFLYFLYFIFYIYTYTYIYTYIYIYI
ncbi:hypothetical protein RIR_jg15368.t1 [Rhizophagus irregularis DAOM 181602=DAOM 197198]|nr:hypothetical protein RIR_jg15368.t1 [Rhizophagus irregularis DAOM 181602=DAOM 197198]